MKLKTANIISGTTVVVFILASTFLHESLLLTAIYLSLVPVALLTTWLVERGKS